MPEDPFSFIPHLRNGVGGITLSGLLLLIPFLILL
mgnify:CR=1 FL=1